MVAIRNIAGFRFGRLLVQDQHEVVTSSKGATKTVWYCLCDCGNYTKVWMGNLVSGSTKSCGCLRKALLDKTTHGLEGHPLYSTWCHMMSRCYSNKDHTYHHYGGRGIRVCNDWHDIHAFIRDMGVRPEGMTLDRKDNEGNYEKGNCRWATHEEQQSNKRNNRNLTFKGVTQTLARWSRQLDIPTETLFSRLKKLSVEEALSLPRKSPNCL